MVFWRVFTDKRCQISGWIWIGKLTRKFFRSDGLIVNGLWWVKSKFNEIIILEEIWWECDPSAHVHKRSKEMWQRPTCGLYISTFVTSSEVYPHHHSAVRPLIHSFASPCRGVATSIHLILNHRDSGFEVSSLIFHPGYSIPVFSSTTSYLRLLSYSFVFPC